MSRGPTAVTASQAALLAILLAASPASGAVAPMERERGSDARPVEAQRAAARLWAVRTHMYLAEEILKDLLPDGKLTIHRTDYHARTIGEKLGEFDVDPLLLAAIRQHPEAFRAGVMAGDSYPDVITGQSVIHPEVAAAWHSHSIGGHDAWLRHLWELRGPPSTPPAARAFVAGVFLHSAGDMYGHTFVNHFTGGAFTLKNPHNAKNHLLIDSYVGVRTPDVMITTRDKVQRISARDVSIAGAEDFIYRSMVDAAPGSTLDTHLLIGEESGRSIPRIFTNLRNQLDREIAWYSGVIASYNTAIKAKYDSALALGCKANAVITDCTPDAWRFKVDAASIEALRSGHMAVQGPIRDYNVQWRNEINRGLKALPQYSQRIVLALLYPIAEPHGVGEALKVAQEYVNLHVLAMGGAPPAVGQGIHLVAQTLDEIKDVLIPREVEKVIDEITRAPLDFMLLATVGMTAAQAEKFLTAPQTHFEEQMKFNPGVGGRAITLAAMNRELGLQDAGFTTGTDKSRPVEYVDYRKVPPLYNTMVLSQLSLLSHGAMNSLRVQIGLEPLTDSSHVMLGFMPSIDGDNQWHGGKDATSPVVPPRMLLAYKCDAYVQIFMRQTGEEGDYSCKGWQPSPLQAATTRATALPGVPLARLGDVVALQRQAIATTVAKRVAARPPPRPRVNPADATFRLSMPVVERWSRAAGVIARSPMASVLARDAGEPLTPTVDALAAALGRSSTATAAVAAHGFPARDFALAHVTLMRAAAAQRDPARAGGISAENLQFVATYRGDIDRLMRAAAVAYALPAAVR